jgi:hypothetical protein
MEPKAIVRIGDSLMSHVTRHTSHASSDRASGCSSEEEEEDDDEGGGASFDLEHLRR